MSCNLPSFFRTNGDMPPYHVKLQIRLCLRLINGDTICLRDLTLDERRVVRNASFVYKPYITTKGRGLDMTIKLRDEYINGEDDGLHLQSDE